MSYKDELALYLAEHIKKNEDTIITYSISTGEYLDKESLIKVIKEFLEAREEATFKRR